MSVPTQSIQFGDDQNYYIYRDTGSGLEPVKQTTIETAFDF